MNLSHNIKLKPKAYNDLDSIYLYSFSHFGKTKAIKYIKDINQAFIKISENNANIQPSDYIKIRAETGMPNIKIIMSYLHSNAFK